VIAHQLCRPIWARWMETAVLAGALDLPGYAAAPGAYRAVQWIPPRWDWVDPLKDIQAQVLAMEAGITSRRKVVEATGYDVEEVDRENATDAARAAGSGPALPHQPRRDAGRAGDAGGGGTPDPDTEHRTGVTACAELVCDPRPGGRRGDRDL
jgi:capsid protein